MKLKKENINFVIVKLRSRGYKITKLEKDQYSVCFEKSKTIDTLNSRAIYKLYKDLFVEVKIGNQTVKKFTGGLDRTATRDMIKTEKFDNIPSKKRTKEIDPWSFD